MPDNGPKWADSEAKEYVYDLLLDGTIPLDYATKRGGVGPKKTHDTHCLGKPTFDHFPYQPHFSSRLRTLREKVMERDNRADRDAEALAHDRTFFPEPTLNTKGQPHWPTSSAMSRLTRDIDKKRHLRMTKKKLYLSRPEHWQKYDLRTFRQHVHQEIRSRKFEKYIRDKRSKQKT